jgi:hypothetical protein
MSAWVAFQVILEHRFTNKNLTPQPPSLQGKGVKEFPLEASGRVFSKITESMF